MWALGVLGAAVAIGAVARSLAVRDNVPPMERHLRALEALRELSEHPTAIETVPPSDDFSTDHVRILEGAPTDPRPLRRTSKRPAARTTRSRRPAKTRAAARAETDRPTIQIRPPTGRVPSLTPDACTEGARPFTGPPAEPPPAFPEPAPVDAWSALEPARPPGRPRVDLARLADRPARVYAAAGVTATVLVAIVVVAAGLGGGGPHRAAATPSHPRPALLPATAPSTTASTPTTVVTQVAAVVDRSPTGATVSVHSPFQLTLEANGTCWVEIRDSAGNTLFTATLHSGDRQQIPGSGPIVVRLGYTPAMTISVDGVGLDLGGLAQTADVSFRTT